MSLIKLKTRVGHTRIHIPGSLQNLADLLPAGYLSKTVILADENVLKFHSEKIKKFPIIPVKEGENSKSLSAYSEIFQFLLDLNVDRSWYMVGVGGGITTDLAGFVASTYFRGIPFGFVSTTLLGQVDAAIGGKNGINYKGYKNLIGVINQPDFVACDIESLKTLAEREFIGGFSEIIKYAFIRRADLYTYLFKNLSAAVKFDEDVLQYLVNESVTTKVDIVSGDEFEKGDRKLLNFGHTFGHALEKIYGISHGEAVAIGMMLAARLSVNLGMVGPEIPSLLEDLLSTAGLPVSMDFDPAEMADTMQRDKKRKGSGIDLILLEGIGKAVIRGIEIKELKTILNDLR